MRDFISLLVESDLALFAAASIPLLGGVALRFLVGRVTAAVRRARHLRNVGEG